MTVNALEKWAGVILFVMVFFMEVDKIICGDCLEVMKDFPDNSVDLVLTDPPYGIGENNQQNLSRKNLAICTDYGEYHWDNKKVSPDHIRICLRVGANQIIFGGNFYGDILDAASCWIVWDKDNFSNDFADCELAWTSFGSAVRKYKYRWCGMLQEPGRPKEKRIHPTQKPLALMYWCLENYSKEGDLILDPFCGSGTTCVAAKMLGRHYIGIDISEKYCEIARKRIEAAEKGITVKELEKGQGVLF